MIINSPFHDYYDYIAKYGRDPKLVYNRKTEELNTRWGSTELTSKFKELKKKDDRFASIVNALDTVVSELHKKVKKDIEESRRVLDSGEAYITIIHSKAFAHVEFTCHEKDWHKPTGIDMHVPMVELTEKRLSELQKVIDQRKNIISQPIDLSVLTSDSFSYFTHAFDCPLMMYKYTLRYTDTTITLNPRLEDYSNKAPAEVVWREIESFLSAAEPTPVPQSDTSKLTAHGFDNNSFKREKGGPTRKRKKRNYAT